jgi:hypothetical protein
MKVSSEHTRTVWQSWQVFSPHILPILIVYGQIFEDASSFHGELKTLSRQIVESEYDIFFPFDTRHNSRDAMQYTAEHVEFYLEKGMFLRDEVLDTEVIVSVLTDLYLTITTMTGTYKKHPT